MVAVRIAAAEDEEGIERVLHASYPTLMKDAYEPAVLALALPLMTRPSMPLIASGRFCVALHEGQVIGCGGWSEAEPGSGRIEKGLAHIRHFAADPTAGQRGVGAALFARCSAEARAAGFARFRAFSSLNAEGFYKRMGLVSLKRIELTMGDVVALPSVLMEGEITDPDC